MDIWIVDIRGGSYYNMLKSTFNTNTTCQAINICIDCYDVVGFRLW